MRYEGPVFPSDHYGSKITLLTTATGRVGYAQDRWLGYVKGGWAGADVDLNILNRFSGVRAHSSTWANGWTVGAGGEYALTRNFSLAVEYDHAGLGIDHWQVCPTCPSGLGGGVPIVDGDVVAQSVTARLNYRFGQ